MSKDRRRQMRRRMKNHTERLLTTREVITFLGISSRTLQRLRNESHIRYVTIRGSCRYPVSEIERISREGATSIYPSQQDNSYHPSALRINSKYSHETLVLRVKHIIHQVVFE